MNHCNIRTLCNLCIRQPTEYDAACLPTIRERTTASPNVHAPVSVDCAQAFDTWSVAGVQTQHYQYALCVNMFHISPWPCTIGAFAGLKHALVPGALLFTYGPYNVNHAFTHVSNEEFDVSLKRRNPEWGVRGTVAEVVWFIEVCPCDDRVCAFRYR